MKLFHYLVLNAVSASNYPVDSKDEWESERLFKDWRKLQKINTVLKNVLCCTVERQSRCIVASCKTYNIIFSRYTLHSRSLIFS